MSAEPAADRRKEYELLDELGEGAYGTVWHAVHRTTREEFAVKVLQVDSDATSRIGAEIDHMRACTHPSICRYFTSFTEGGVFIYIF